MLTGNSIKVQTYLRATRFHLYLLRLSGCLSIIFNNRHSNENPVRVIQAILSPTRAIAVISSVSIYVDICTFKFIGRYGGNGTEIFANARNNLEFSNQKTQTMFVQLQFVQPILT